MLKEFIKLNPCPNCEDGGKPEIMQEDPYTYIECGKCESRTFSYANRNKGFTGKALAIMDWNRRIIFES